MDQLKLIDCMGPIEFNGPMTAKKKKRIRLGNTTIALSLPRVLVHALRERAKKERRPLSWTARDALEKGLGRRRRS